MTNLEWFLNAIKIQVKSVRANIDGLPKDVQEKVTQECIDILKGESNNEDHGHD